MSFDKMEGQRQLTKALVSAKARNKQLPASGAPLTDLPLLNGMLATNTSSKLLLHGKYTQPWLIASA